MIRRRSYEDQIRRLLRSYPVTVILGPRQCGKTTLARTVAEESRSHCFDCENPRVLVQLSEPMLALEKLRGLIVIDEIQFRPDLFPVLRVLADRQPRHARFLILGSASPDHLRQDSDTLAGRAAFLELAGFHLEEVGSAKIDKLWWRGGFPRAYLPRTDAEGRDWISHFTRTFLERDMRKFGVNVPPEALRRLWSMIAHYHGQISNSMEIGRSLGQSHTTAIRHLDILTGSLVLRRIPPYYVNISSRQVKAPKYYVRDSGVLHFLLDIPSFEALQGHPKVGASWEGFVIEEIIRCTRGSEHFFWRTHGGSELDLLVLHNQRRIGFEVKYADAPARTKSMTIAMETLKLDALYVVYPGKDDYFIGTGMRVIPFHGIANMFETKKRQPGMRRKS